MLVIVEYGDVHDFFQFVFNIIALGRRNIFQVDRRKAGFQRFYDGDKFIGILVVDADGNRVHTAEAFEQDRLAFHDRICGSRADIAQAQYAGAVGADTYQIAAGGIFKSHVRFYFDFLTGFRYARGVSNRQVVAVIQGVFEFRLQNTMNVKPHL